MRAGCPQREQPFLDALELVRIVVGGAQRRVELAPRLVERVQRRVERFHHRVDQRRRLGGTPLQPPDRRRQHRHRRSAARHRLLRVAQVARDLLGLHHGGALLGERGLLLGLGAELAQFLDRVPQPVGLALRALDLGAQRGQLRLLRAALVPEPRDPGGLVVEAAIGIEQRAMGRRVDQRALVVLAVNLHQRRAERAQHLDADRLVVDERAGAAVGHLHAAQDQFVLDRNVIVRQQRPRRVRGRQIEGRRHLPLLGALAHQRGVAAGAERQREGIEQDRLAGPGLAGQDRKAGGEIDVEPVDQDDVADREPGKHGDCGSEYWAAPGPARADRDSPSSETAMAGTSPATAMWVIC